MKINQFFKVIVIVTLLSSTAPADTGPAYRCYGQTGYDICVPSISMGENLLAVAPSSSIFGKMDSDMRRTFGIIFPVVLYQEIPPKTPAELKIAADRPGSNLARINLYFPPFAAGNFNKDANFSGPNCYNTALVTTGTLSENEIRYVGSGEFELYLKYFYEKTADQKAGDIAVYNANSARDHAAVYLFSGLVFHKKDVSKKYIYRIVPVNEVFRIEPNEWQPGPFDDYSPAHDSETVDTTKIAYYRKTGRGPEEAAPSLKVKKQTAIINMLGDEVLKDAPDWNIGKTMGIISETLASDLEHEFSSLETSEVPSLKLAYAKLDSLYYQIEKSIEESHFSSRYASANPEKINEQICVAYNDYLENTVKMLLDYYEKPTDPETVKTVFDKIKSYDRKECRISIVRIVKSL